MIKMMKTILNEQKNRLGEGFIQRFGEIRFPKEWKEYSDLKGYETETLRKQYSTVCLRKEDIFRKKEYLIKKISKNKATEEDLNQLKELQRYDFHLQRNRKLQRLDRLEEIIGIEVKQAVLIKEQLDYFYNPDGREIKVFGPPEREVSDYWKGYLILREVLKASGGRVFDEESEDYQDAFQISALICAGDGNAPNILLENAKRENSWSIFCINQQGFHDTCKDDFERKKYFEMKEEGKLVKILAKNIGWGGGFRIW